jgi:hypothetical protein
MQLIHHSRAHMHPSMPTPQPLPQIAILGIRYPDAREAVLEHQSQQQLRVLPIRFLLAHSPGLNFGQISDPQLQPKLVQQTLEPARVSAGLHAHPCGSISLV